MVGEAAARLRPAICTTNDMPSWNQIVQAGHPERSIPNQSPSTPTGDMPGDPQACTFSNISRRPIAPLGGRPAARGACCATASRKLGRLSTGVRCGYSARCRLRSEEGRTGRRPGIVPVVTLYYINRYESVICWSQTRGALIRLQPWKPRHLEEILGSAQGTCRRKRCSAGPCGPRYVTFEEGHRRRSQPRMCWQPLSTPFR